MTLMFVIAAVVASVWCAVFFYRGGLICGGLAVLVVGACFGHPFFHTQVGPIPVTADRLLWLVLIAQYLLWRRFGRAEPKPAGKPEWLLLGMMGLLVLSTFSHDWRADGAQPVAWLIVFYVMPIGVYWVARQAAVSRREVLILFGALAAFGVYLAFTAIAETNQWWWMVYPKYITYADYGGFILGRGRGPFLNPSACGLFQGTCLCALLMWWPRVGRLGKLVLMALTLLMLAGIYSTLTRSAWLGGAVGVMIVLWFAVPRTMRMPLVAGSLILAGLVVATQWNNLIALKRDRGVSAQAAADSIKLRPVLAVVAWNMFRERPLLGHGYGQYNTAKVHYLGDRSTDLVLESSRPFHQHNVFLNLLVETGLLGMCAFTVVLAFWARDAWRLASSATAPLWVRQLGVLLLALGANYVITGMFQDVAVMSSVNMLFFFVAGTTAAMRPQLENATALLPTPPQQ
jgi:O-antigen ligase